MTTNIWINQVMKDIPQFVGVKSSDQVIKPPFFPCYTIVNFSPSFLPGTHFIVILFVKKTKCIYYDPLGISGIPKEILDYMQKYSRDVVQINHPIQNPISSFCGFFCMLPILLHVNRLPILQGIYSFKKHEMENEIKCVNLLARLFKLYYLDQVSIVE